MKQFGLLLTGIVLSACVTPGQHMNTQSWVYEEPVAQEYDLQRLSPDLVVSLHTALQVESGINAALQKEIDGYEYRIGPKDVLTFTVWDHPELTIPAGEFRAPEIQGHLVSRRGAVFFPYIGEVMVTGRTLPEVRTIITDRLSRYIQNPQLDVRIASFRSKRVNVTGQVKNPGFFSVTDIPMTLVEALSLAGGATPEAALQTVRVTRDGRSMAFDVQALLEHGDLTQNILLTDRDIVYVPDNSFYSVHMLGSVAKPGVVSMRNGRLNLAESITHSGGFNDDEADAERVFVFRNGPERPQVYWLDARSPDAMLLATQFRMQPQDVVFVAPTGIARWNRVVKLVLPTIQTLWQTQSFIDRLND